MLRLFARRVNTPDLLKSALYDERRFYKAFVGDLKRAKASIIIESPYLTFKRAAELAPVFKKLNRRGVTVRVNTREPAHHTEILRQQSLEAIQVLKKAGVKVYVCSDYRHRKLAIIDEQTLWEGSLNILSQHNSREVMRRTVSASLCRQMVSFTGINRKFW